MIKDKTGGKRGSGGMVITPQTTLNQTLNQAMTGSTKMDDSYADQLRKQYAGNYNANTMPAIKTYISDAVNSNGFSDSQNLNYALDNNKPLDVDAKMMDTNLQKAMHPIGMSAELIRGCHDDILKSIGISDYTKLTESQLQQKLVGGEFTSKAYMSFAYDAKKNPFIPNNKFAGTSQDQSGGREIIIKTKTTPTTNVVLGAKHQAEVIVNKGTKYRFTKVYYSGGTASPRNYMGSKPVLVLEVEVI